MQKPYFTTKKICITAAFLALNVIMSSSFLSIPVPGGHLYLNDSIISLAALVLDPISAFIVGGVGAFIGDALFYPTPMFVSLVTHGLQAVAISLIAGTVRKDGKPQVLRAIIALVVGALISVVGYSVGRAFIYATPETAMLKLPFQIFQASVGSVIAGVLIYLTPLAKVFVDKKTTTDESSSAPASDN